MTLFSKLMHKKASLFIMSIRALIIVTKFAITIFIAKYMGLEDLGIYGLLSSTIVLVPVVFRGGMQNILTREAVTQSKENLARNLFHYYTAVIGIYVFALFAILLSFSVIGFQWFPILVLALIVIEHVIVDWFFILISLRRAVLANIMLFAQASGWIISFILFAWFYPDLREIETLLVFWICGGLFAGTLTVRFWLSFPWRSVIANNIHKDWYKEYWRKSRLFFVSDVANAGGVHLDRFIVTAMLGLELTGVYVLFWQMANALHTLVSTGILQLHRPNLIKAHADKAFDAFKTLYKKSLKDVFLTSIALALIVAAVSPFVTELTDRQLAQSYLPVLWAMLVCMIFRVLSDTSAIGLLASYKDKILVFSNLFNVLTAITLVTAGIYFYGIYGAAFGLIINYVCLFIYRHHVLKNFDSKH